MSIKHIFLLIPALLSVRAYSQTFYGTVAPDSIRTKCDQVIVSEIGKTAFEKNVKLIKCDAFKGNGNDKYTLFYSFKFPNVSESHVIFTLDYKPGKGVVKDAAFKNYTRLPASIKTKGAKIVEFSRAKNAALASDSVLMHNSSNVYGELSTEYSEKKKDYFFVWYFYSIVPCKNCTDKPFSMSSAYVDAATGKAIPKPN
jgi:hypothetical protein